MAGLVPAIHVLSAVDMTSVIGWIEHSETHAAPRDAGWVSLRSTHPARFNITCFRRLRSWMPGTSPGMTPFPSTRRSRVLDVLLKTRIDQLALHQRQRRLVVQLEIAEGVGEDFRHPDQAGL